jgi:hypothetical protein|tara:strand:- start:4917 stop:5348 length:432 start_codon:yes stop_codon:yes gene_type:complete
MYVKLLNNTPNKFPYNLGELKKENPNTSFPNPMSNSTLADFDVYPVTPTTAPAFDNTTHRLRNWVENTNQEWRQTWTIQQLPEEQASANVRGKRDRLLADSDWTQLPDAPVDAAAWETYRTALRDITDQTGFPWNVTWPVAPS